MKYIIEYYYIKSDHLLAIPEYDHKEIVEAKSIKILYDYIKSKKDEYGNPFHARTTKSFGFDFVSNAGGIKIKKYIRPKIKQLN